MYNLITFLKVLYLFMPNHRLAISGADVIVNDINNPYSQNEIMQIANIKVIKNDVDITNEMILVENEYLNKENIVGIYKQKFLIVDNEYDGQEHYEVNYYYTLTIYNIDKQMDYQEVIINTDPNNYLSKTKLIEELEKILLVEIFEYEEISSNYIREDVEGTYNILAIITTNKNQKIKVSIQINSKNVKKDKTVIKIVVVSSIFTTTSFLIIRSIIRRKKT